MDLPGQPYPSDQSHATAPVPEINVATLEQIWEKISQQEWPTAQVGPGDYSAITASQDVLEETYSRLTNAGFSEDIVTNFKEKIAYIRPQDSTVEIPVDAQREVVQAFEEAHEPINVGAQKFLEIIAPADVWIWNMPKDIWFKILDTFPTVVLGRLSRTDRSLYTLVTDYFQHSPARSNTYFQQHLYHPKQLETAVNNVGKSTKTFEELQELIPEEEAKTEWDWAKTKTTEELYNILAKDYTLEKLAVHFPLDDIQRKKLQEALQRGALKQLALYGPGASLPSITTGTLYLYNKAEVESVAGTASVTIDKDGRASNIIGGHVNVNAGTLHKVSGGEIQTYKGAIITKVNGNAKIDIYGDTYIDEITGRTINCLHGHTNLTHVYGGTITLKGGTAHVILASGVEVTLEGVFGEGISGELTSWLRNQLGPEPKGAFTRDAGLDYWAARARSELRDLAGENMIYLAGHTPENSPLIIKGDLTKLHLFSAEGVQLYPPLS